MKYTEPPLWGVDRKVCKYAAPPSDCQAVGDFVMAGWSLIHRECVNLVCGMRKAASTVLFRTLKNWHCNAVFTIVRIR